MQIQQVEYIVEVAKTGKIATAAENLHVSPAALSMSITNLEKELGIEIFKRTRTGSVPTAEGEEILKKANELAIKYREFMDEVQRQSRVNNGELKFLATTIFFMTFLPKTLISFKAKYANAKVNITEESAEFIFDKVRKNESDFGLILVNDDALEKYEDEHLEYEVLLRTQLYACVSKKSPLVSRKVLTFEELFEHPIVLYNNYEKIFSEYGAKNILFTTNNSEILKKAVVEGQAICFLFDIMLGHDPYLANDQIIPIPLAEERRITAPLILLRSKRGHLSQLSKEFIALLKHHIQSETGH